MLTIVKKLNYVNLGLSFSKEYSVNNQCKCLIFKKFHNETFDKAFYQVLKQLNHHYNLNSEAAKIKCYSSSAQSFQFLENKLTFEANQNENIFELEDRLFCNTDRQWSQNLKKEFFSNLNQIKPLTSNLKTLWFSHRNKHYKKKFDYKSLLSVILSPQNFQHMLNVLEKELEVSKNEGSLFLCSLRFSSKLFFSQSGVKRVVSEFENLIQFLKCHFSAEEIINSRYLLLFRYSTIQNRVQFLKDFGVQNLKTLYIKHYRFIIESNEKKLKELGVIEEDVSVIENMLNCLKDLNEEEKVKFRNDLSSQSSILNLKTNIMQKYLKRNVQGRYNNFPRLILNSHVSLSKLFNIFQKLDQIKFPSINITMSSWKNLIETKQSILDDIFEKIPKLYGKRIFEIVLLNTNVFKIPYSLLLDKLHLLKVYYQLNDEQIEHQPEAIRIRIDLLKSRLDYLITIFGPEILKEPTILSLVILSKKKVDRLSIEKKKIDKNFNIKENLDFKFWNTINHEKFKLKKKFELVSISLGINQLIIKKTLKNHPFKNYLEVENSKKVWSYFLSEQLTLNQLTKGLYVILYDFNLIKATWMNLKKTKIFEEWKDNESLLIYLVYLIEKKHQFNGKAVLIGKNQINETNIVKKQSYLKNRI